MTKARRMHGVNIRLKETGFDNFSGRQCCRLCRKVVLSPIAASSSDIQGESVGPGQNARKKYSAPGYRLSQDHFQTVKRMLAPDCCFAHRWLISLEAAIGKPEKANRSEGFRAATWTLCYREGLDY